MRSIDFTPEQEDRRAIAEHMARAAINLHLDTPEHRIMVLSCLIDELIGEVTDLAVVRACVLTLTQTYTTVLSRASIAEGRA